MLIIIFLVDDIFLDVICFDEVVVEKYNTIFDRVNIFVIQRVIVWDYSGISFIFYYYEGRRSEFFLRYFINVIVLVFDSKGNIGICYFLYEGKSKLFFEFVFYK